MGIDFRGTAVAVLGELPETSIWLYDIFTIFMVIGIIFILLLPIICLVRRFGK